jgi:hypothetical protein
LYAPRHIGKTLPQFFGVILSPFSEKFEAVSKQDRLCENGPCRITVEPLSKAEATPEASLCTEKNIGKGRTFNNHLLLWTFKSL